MYIYIYIYIIIYSESELVDTDLSTFLRDNEERKQTLKEILYLLFLIR